MVNIWTSDVVIADYAVQSTDALDTYIQEHGYEFGKKNTVDDPKEFSRLLNAAIHRDTTHHDFNIWGHTLDIGGSSLNSVDALKRLYENANITFTTALGNGEISDMMRDQIKASGIHLDEKFENVPIRNASSIIAQHPATDEAERTTTYLIHDGSFRELMTPDVLDVNMLKEQDVLFMQGSCFRKMSGPFIDKILDLRWDLNKELWFSLPTREKFARENAQRVREEIIPSTHVLMANDKELLWTYSTVGPELDEQGNQQYDDNDDPKFIVDEDMTIETALLKLWGDIKQHKTIFETEKKMPTQREPVAFITLGKRGSAIVTEQGIFIVPGLDLAEADILDERGAGDSAYGAFLTAMLEGKTYLEAAWRANQYAGEKLQTLGPRVVDPRGTYDTLESDIPCPDVKVLAYTPPEAGAEVDSALHNLADCQRYAEHIVAAA